MAWKINQSAKVNQLFIAPGNAGTAEFGENIAVGVTDFEALKKVVLEKTINLVVVGPEVPLVEGLHDFFAADTELASVKVYNKALTASEVKQNFNAHRGRFGI